MIEKAICLWFLFFIWFLFALHFYWFFFILYFVCFGKILSQLEAASSVLPRIETFARCPRVVPSAAPRALRSSNALRFLCSVEPRTQLLILTYEYYEREGFSQSSTVSSRSQRSQVIAKRSHPKLAKAQFSRCSNFTKNGLT